MSLIKLQQMVESKEKHMYRGQVAVFKSWEHKHGNIEVIVDLDGKPSVFTKSTEETVKLWLSNFKHIEEADTSELASVALVQPHKMQHVDIFSENRKQMSTLSQVLLEDIEKIRKDPAYVAQAKQVCNTVNAIVNITKLQIQMIKGE